jgi:hypothetical protein
MRFADGSSMMRHYFIRLGFLGGWSQLLPDGRRAEALTALAERLDEVAEREGGLKMTIPMVLIAAERPRSEPPATNA